MNPKLYDQFFEIESTHWWFIGRRKILEFLLKDAVKKYLKPKMENHSEPFSILDLGCGCGLNLEMLKQFGNVRGVDYSQQAVDYCNQRFLFNVTVAKLPDHLDVSFQNLDIITAFDVIEHIAEDEESLDVVYHRLKNGGILVCSVPAYQWLWSEHDVINYHIRRYTKRQLEQRLKKAGFTVKKISYFNFFLFPVISISRLSKKLFSRSGQPESDFKTYPRVINLILTAVFSSERRLIKHVSLPFGVSIVAVAQKIQGGSRIES